MKYFLILVVACSPLLILAGLSVVDLMQAAPAGVIETAPVDVTKAEALAAAAKERAQNDAPFVKLLAEADPFDAGPAKNDPLLGASVAGFEPVIEGWKKAKSTRSWIADYAASDYVAAGITDPAALLSDKAGEAEGVLKKLDAFLAAEKQARPAGEPSVAPVIKVLEGRREAISQLLAARTKHQLITGGMKAAADNLEKDQPEKSLTTLEGEDFLNIADASQRKEFDALIKRVRYRIAANALLKQGPVARVVKVEEFDLFLKQQPDVPSGEEPTHEKILLARAKANLNRQIAVLGEENEFEKILNDSIRILEDPILLQDSAEAARVKGQLRERLRKWLSTSGMPELTKPPVLLGGKQEVVVSLTKERVVGYFELPDGSLSYRYWKSDVNKNNSNYERTFRTDVILERPAKLRYVKFADDYNEDVRMLLLNDKSMEQFQQFMASCSKLQAELVSYRNDYAKDGNDLDVQCAKFNFSKPAAAAKQVLDNWERYRKIVEN